MEFTDKRILILNDNEIYVFGSNAEGIHGKGGALIAKQLFGAAQGQAEGIQGKSYAVITKRDWRVEKSSPLSEIQDGILKMLQFASSHKHLKFYVTKLGSSLAGYSVMEIRGLFENLTKFIPDNVVLPREYEVRYDKMTRDDLDDTFLQKDIIIALNGNDKDAIELAIGNTEFDLSADIPDNLKIELKFALEILKRMLPKEDDILVRNYQEMMFNRTMGMKNVVQHIGSYIQNSFSDMISGGQTNAKEISDAQKDVNESFEKLISEIEKCRKRYTAILKYYSTDNVEVKKKMFDLISSDYAKEKIK